ncbi:MAG: penicillin acylase family protein [Actinomycetota bacterium]
MGDDFLEALRSQAAAALFPTEGELPVTGLAAPVTIRRDAWGTPSIDAASLEDLWFAQGLVTAGERLFQLDLAIRASTGRLAEVFGPSVVDTDTFARTVGFHRAGARYLEGWTERDHAMHERFRAGVLAWVAAMPATPIEYQLLDLDPVLPEDPADWSACFAFLAWGLSNNHDKEILRAQLAAALGPDAARVWLPATAGGTGLGSNDWVVAGSRTASGAPLLANDPHLLALQPGAWLELHLSAPGYLARGVALCFSPGLILGATPHHAWGATNVTGDVQDLFEVGDADVTGERAETIAVRGEDEPRTLTVRETRFGPILTHVQVGLLDPASVALDRTYALAWTGHEHGIRPSLALDAAQASSFDGFRTAVLEIGCPGQNFVYADVGGTIALQVTGLHPVRRAGDGLAPAPGDTDDHAWDGWVPLDELPREVDPARGFIVTANDGLHASMTPHLLSNDFHEPYRALRIAELLETRDDHDVASCAAIQTDTVSLPARAAAAALARLAPDTDAQRRALEALAAWDGDVAAGSRPAALYHAWTTAIARRALGPRLPEEVLNGYLAWGETWRCQVLPSLLEDPGPWLSDDLLRAALGDALEEVGDRTWGELHRLVLAHPLARIPGLEALFVAADEPFAGDEQTVASGGYDATQRYRAAVIASWRVVWDLADLDRSVAVLPSGASGNPASPHWNDQSPLYLSGRTRPAPVGPDAVRAASVATLSVLPA